MLYTAIARRGPAPVQVKKLDNTKIRRTVVKIRDDAEQEAVKAPKKEDLVQAFKNSANKATKDIVAAYTKLSKEVVLVTALVRGREALEARKEQVSLKYSSAEVRRQTFLVAVYRVRRSDIDKKRQTEVISKILEANKVLYLELQIVRFQQLKNVEKPGPQETAKTISTLVVELLIPEGVNEVVAKRIVGGRSLLKYERQKRDRVFRQYFRCLKYDYRLY